jgi:formylglycine-generating enzyme required for sulfatase activity
MSKFYMLFISTLITVSLNASDIVINNIKWISNNQKPVVQVDISWKNAWSNNRNHDAAWVFVKYQSPQYRTATARHAKVSQNGHRVLYNHIKNSALLNFEVPDDKTGVFLFPSSAYRGNIHATIEIALDNEIYKDPDFHANERLLSVYAIETVKIPSGAFFAGDPLQDTAWLKTNHSFFMSDGSGKSAGAYKISNENTPVTVGNQQGNLHYFTSEQRYQGDVKGVIPATFPKGVNAFYIMKYEITQGQYASFLNAVSIVATQNRANFGARNYYTFRGTIRFENNRYISGSPNRPCNFISWDDEMAFADWACLRPMTELEFEKACRGNRNPIHAEYPWNTTSYDSLQRTTNETGELVFLGNIKEENMTDENRHLYGASFYWVFDLAGSLWERCITIGDSTGRAFKGTHGDGNLRFGYATNEDWPKGNTETSGFGFRGGGFYEYDMLYGGINPYSIICNRAYSAWSGGYGYHAYGGRLVRTSNQQ